MTVKILYIDIETAPHTAYVWGLFKETVNSERIIDTGRVLCFAYRWNNDKKIHFVSERDGRAKMLDEAHRVLDEADIIVTYNGNKFDIPMLNRELIKGGYPPPAPSKQIDLYRVVRSRFRFASNKLDMVASELNLRRKVRHSGFDLWVRCMAGEPKAWAKMERYNKRDVLILEKLYHRVLPWIKGHPNVALFSSSKPVLSRPACPACGEAKLTSRGFATNKSRTYRRYQCSACGSWSRSEKCEKASSPVVVTSHG